MCLFVVIVFCFVLFWRGEERCVVRQGRFGCSTFLSHQIQFNLIRIQFSPCSTLNSLIIIHLVPRLQGKRPRNNIALESAASCLWLFSDFRLAFLALVTEESIKKKQVF